MWRSKTSDSTYEEHLPTIAKGAGINFFGTLAGKVLVLLIYLLIARLLGPRQLGLYFLGLSLITILIEPALLGFDSGIVRYVALFKGENNDEKVKKTVFSSLWIVLPLSLLTSILLFIFADEVSVAIFHKPQLTNVLRFLSLSIPFLAISTIFIAATQALKLMQYKVYTKDLADSIFKIVLICIFILLGWKLFGVIFATIISSILVAALSFYYVNKHIPLLRRSSQSSPVLKDLLKFSVPQTFSRTLVLGTQYTDILILGYFLVASDVGIYNIAVKIALLGTLVLDSFNVIFAPIISNLYNQKELDLLSNLFKTITKWVFALSLPLSLAIIFLSKPILGVFGEEFVKGSAVLIVLSLGQIISSATGPVGFMIVMSGRPVLQLVTNIIAFVLSISLNYLLIPKYGILGAGMATAITISTLNIIRLALVKLFMGMHPYKLSYLKPLFAGATASLLVFLGLRLVLTGSPIFLVVLLGTTFFVIYAIFLLLFGIEAEDRLVIQAIKKKLVFVGPMFNRFS